MKRLVSKRDGFTLIELLVVITIIGILATLAPTAINGVLKNAKQTKAINVARNIGTAIKMFQADHDGDYPTALKELVDPGAYIKAEAVKVPGCTSCPQTSSSTTSGSGGGSTTSSSSSGSSEGADSFVHWDYKKPGQSSSTNSTTSTSSGSDEDQPLVLEVKAHAEACWKNQFVAFSSNGVAAKYDMSKYPSSGK